MLQELTIAIRTLWKQPAYALSVIATLAVGIGATTLMFSLMDAALLRRLPFLEPDRLVFLTGVAGPQRSPRGGSFPEVGDWRTMNATLEDVSLYDDTSLNLRIGDTAMRVETEMVNAGYFRLLGVEAALGRTFRSDEDEVQDRNAVAVISHSLWRDRFGGDRDILQRQIHLNDRPFTIVGVMPERFAGVSFDTDVWVPSMMVSLTSAPTVVRNRNTRWLGAIGRVKAGVTRARAQDDLSRVAAILEERHPESNRQRSVQVDGLRQAFIGNTRTLVVSLFGAVVLFLVVACANVASLQLARASGRTRELAVRLALGARRYHVDIAFDPAHVMAARMTLPASRYAPEQRVQFAQRLTERLREIPGVSSAAVATSLPFTGNSNASTLSVDGQADAEAVQRYYRNSVTPELFSALQVRVVRGRAFTDQDTAGAPPVAIINEGAAKRLWPDNEAVGRRIRLGNGSGPAVEIVGVVADARFRDLTTDLRGARVEPDVYFPFAQRPDRDLEIAVRTREGSSISLASLQQAIAGVDATLPVYAVQPLETALQQQTSTARFGSWLLAVFSVGALLLSAIGLYGLVSYVVGLSRREIAIRMALGANARRVVGLITGNGLTLVCAGIVMGVAGGVLAGRALQSQLFQTTAYDVKILAIVSLLMLSASAAAILIPTRHAVRVDPHAALRAD